MLGTPLPPLSSFFGRKPLKAQGLRVKIFACLGAILACKVFDSGGLRVYILRSKELTGAIVRGPATP